VSVRRDASLALRASLHCAYPARLRSPLSADPFRRFLIPLVPRAGRSRARPGILSLYPIGLSIPDLSRGKSPKARLHAFPQSVPLDVGTARARDTTQGLWLPQPHVRAAAILGEKDMGGGAAPNVAKRVRLGLRCFMRRGSILKDGEQKTAKWALADGERSP
jgi:hypothetical protein